MRGHIKKLSVSGSASVVIALGINLAVINLQARPTSTQSTVYPGAQWETARPEEVGMDPVKFDEAMATLPSPAVVIRHGKIVGSKGDITRSAHIFSASKSLTALIAARLIQQGQIHYDTLVPASNVPTDPLASYRQFMSMTSDFYLSPHSPGSHYAYNNLAVNHYGNYLKDTYFPGRTYVEMLKDAYLTAIGAEDSLNFDGHISGWDGGWAMSTRDLARVGYLVLRNGAWNGQQLLPASFVSDLYQNQVPGSATAAIDESDPIYNATFYTSHLAGAYSFGFWLPHRGTYFEGQSMTEAIGMSGALGTTVFISRATDLVIAAVNTSLDHAEEKIISSATLDLFAKAILLNFYLSTTVPARAVSTSESTSYIITVVPSGSFTGIIDFSVSGLPDGASARFSASSVNISGSTTMTVSKGINTPAGVYPLMITGVSGSLQQTIPVMLVVTRAPTSRRAPVSRPSLNPLRVP